MNDVIKNASVILAIGSLLYGLFKYIHYVVNLKQTRREELKIAFDKTVAQLSSDIPTSQLSAAILLRRFLGKDIAEKFPKLEKETINVISSLAKTLPTTVFQKTLVDGLAYASDLSLCDLQKTNLQDALIDNKNHPVIMHGTDLFLADLSYANLEGIQAQGIILYRAILFCTRIKNCDFTDANFVGADLTGVAFKNCIFKNADFTGAINIPNAIREVLVNGKYPSNDEPINAKHESKGKSIFFSMPGVMAKEDELMTKDFKRLLEDKGFDVIYYTKDEYPRFGQFNRVREDITKSCAMVAFGLKQINIHSASFRPGTEDEKNWNNVWLSTPWNEIEVGMGLMKGIPILLVSDPDVNIGVFDNGLSECFVTCISTTEDCRKLEQNKEYDEWFSKIEKEEEKKVTQEGNNETADEEKPVINVNQEEKQDEVQIQDTAVPD